MRTLTAAAIEIEGTAEEDKAKGEVKVSTAAAHTVRGGRATSVARGAARATVCAGGRMT